MSNNIKVDLIAYTPFPLDVVYTAMRCCYYAGTPNEMFQNCESIPEEKKIDLINKVIKSHHWSTIEHVSLTFAISGIDRNCSHQLVRKRIASYSQQSLRYTNITKDCDLKELYIIKAGNKPDEYGIQIASKYFTDVNKDNYLIYIDSLINYIEAINRGIKKENARNMLCSNTRTNLVMTLNLRSFLDLLGHRCCTRAQLPIRVLANKMAEVVRATGEFKFIERYLDAKCVQSGFCDEEQSCHRKPTLSEVLSTNKLLYEDETVLSTEDWTQLMDAIVKKPEVNQKLAEFMKGWNEPKTSLEIDKEDK